jgi:hypothetical protein
LLYDLRPYVTALIEESLRERAAGPKLADDSALKERN